jgi:hypothetical protein
MPLVAATRAKQDANLLSLARIKYLGACPYGVASRSGTRQPEIGRGSRNPNMDNFARLQFDEEEGKERPKEEIGHLQEVARPDLSCMGARDRSPTFGLVAGGCEQPSCTSEWFACRHEGPASEVLLESAPRPRVDCPSPSV